MSLSYQGEADEWKFSANIDLFAGIRTGRDTDTESPSGRQECTYDEESIYSAKEGYSRFNASHTLWKGNVLFGLSFDNYIQDTRRKDYSVKEGPVHNNSYNIIPGGYVSLEQDFGFLELDAGIHYQYFYSRYSPYEDDRTLERIRELMESDFISFRDQLLHPHLTISAPIGIWTTDLTATIHKQWLHMELADPQDNLTAPLATVNWINSLSLPWGMIVDLSTLLRTKGAESNIY